MEDNKEQYNKNKKKVINRLENAGFYVTGPKKKDKNYSGFIGMKKKPLKLHIPSWLDAYKNESHKNG